MKKPYKLEVELNTDMPEHVAPIPFAVFGNARIGLRSIEAIFADDRQPGCLTVYLHDGKILPVTPYDGPGAE